MKIAVLSRSGSGYLEAVEAVEALGGLRNQSQWCHTMDFAIKSGALRLFRGQVPFSSPDTSIELFPLVTLQI